MIKTILFAERNSNYNKVGGLNIYDSTRNAFNYQSMGPVIAHPPCRLFSKLRYFSNAPSCERLCAMFALQVVRECGGILEHPRASTLFKGNDFLLSGQVDKFGGFLRSVDLSWFGFPAQKTTMLYFVGISPGQLPAFPLSFDLISHTIGRYNRVSNKKELSKSLRSSTPVGMVYWLLDVLDIIIDNKAIQEL